MAEWKPINVIQTKINIDEQELDNHTFKESSAQWLEYNTKNNKHFCLMEGLDGWVGGWVEKSLFDLVIIKSVKLFYVH